MHLFFSNIYTYNGAGSAFGKMGARIEAIFEERWAASGLGSGAPRQRRATAGHAAPKFEPDLPPPEKRSVPRAPGGSKPAGNGKVPSRSPPSPLNSPFHTCSRWMSLHPLLHVVPTGARIMA